jgi:murein DD-endopeptidase MepM/ murein hydrolase activator NlpD
MMGRSIIVLLSAALLLPGDTASASSDEPRTPHSRVAMVAARLREVQSAMDEITERKRATYARTLRVETRIPTLRRAVAAIPPVGARARGMVDPRDRWSALCRARFARDQVLRRLDGTLAEYRLLRDLTRSQREELKVYLAEVHGLIRALPRSVRTDAEAWTDVWAIDRRPLGPLHVCPVAGPWSLTDTFGAPRPGGRTHEGNDVIAAWDTPVVAAHAGTAIRSENGLGGRAVVVSSPLGRSYYAHLSGYAAAGPVAAGDIIGFVGNSGNARGRIHHLHFQWAPSGGPDINPYELLLSVCEDRSST